MERNQKILLIFATLLIICGIGYIISGMINTDKYAGISLVVEPATSTFVPRNPAHCYIGAESMPPETPGSRITLHSAYMINNTGIIPPVPSSIYLAVGDDLLDEKPIQYEVPTNATVYGGPQEFSFDAREFLGPEYDPQNVFQGNVNFNFRLIYCSGCTDPIKEGMQIYEENTQNCFRIQCSTCTQP